MIVFDFETRSELNISNRRHSIPAASTFDYSHHPSTEVLCLSWAVDDGPVLGYSFPTINTREHGDMFDLEQIPGDPPELLEQFLDAVKEGHQMWAHNAYFERNIWNNLCVPRLGWPEVPMNRWNCSMALAGHFGLPLGLDQAAEVLGIPGKADDSIMHKLCMPTSGWFSKKYTMKWAGTPAEFKQLLEYCRQDVAVTRQLIKLCPKMGAEREVWLADQAINDLGVYVDRELVKACDSQAAVLGVQAGHRLTELTGGRVTKATQRKRIVNWLKAQGVPVLNAQQKHLEDLLLQVDHPDHREVIEWRLHGQGASLSKFKSILARVSPDGRLKGAYLYCGARTGRWTSKGAQLQNPAKPAKHLESPDLQSDLADLVLADDMETVQLFGTTREVLTALVRPAFRAAPGNVLVALDYSAIEARITAWLAGEKKLLELFKAGEDPYMDMAKRIDPRNPNRGLGKAAILGLGYGMGADTFYATCLSWGMKVDRETVDKAHQIFRSTYRHIMSFWFTMEGGFDEACLNPDKNIPCGRLTWYYYKAKKVLLLRLPSGRCVFYHHPVNGERGHQSYLGRMGVSEQGAIGRVHGWGGKWVENAVQATAADVQRYAITTITQQLKWPVVMHSHDEVVIECPEAEAAEAAEQMKEVMVNLPAWSEGLPLDASGWAGVRYRKD